MNRKDQQLIYEAYIKVLEKAPESVFSRVGRGLKGWALSHLNKGILSPFFAASQERLDADSEAMSSINKQKAQLEATYKQQTGAAYNAARGADKQFVSDYIKNNMGVDLNDPEISRFLTADPVTDKNINEALKKAYAQKVRSQGGRGGIKYKFGQMITNLKSTNTFSGNHGIILKQTMGDYNKSPSKDVKFVDTNDANPMSLENIVKLLMSNKSNKVQRAIPYLQKFYNDLD
jgi:hypothetical protein